MPLPKTRPDYLYLLIHLAEAGKRPIAIAQHLKEFATLKESNDAPGLRTVERSYYEYMKQPPDVRRQQTEFRWPDAMIANALPWETGRSALDLLRFRDELRC